MKIVSFTALHYGLPYLHAAIRSVIDAVDEHYIIYSDIGSHGHRTDIPCPDKREDLMEVAYSAAGDKLRWFEGQFTHEGAQRDMIFQVAPDADVIIVVDSDEIWDAGLLHFAVRKAIVGTNYRRLRIPMVHFWRSFHKAVIRDPAYPIRVIYPNHPDRETTYTHTLIESGQLLSIAHMGYAIPPYLMEYKWRIHGHLNELRRDVDWFNDVFMANRQYDCHPVGSEYWNPETVNPWDYLPDWMKNHPYANREVIE